MRAVYHAQLPLTTTSEHPRAEELVEMSRVLDANHSVLDAVHRDLLRLKKAASSAESVGEPIRLG